MQVWGFWGGGVSYMPGRGKTRIVLQAAVSMHAYMHACSCVILRAEGSGPLVLRARAILRTRTYLHLCAVFFDQHLGLQGVALDALKQEQVGR